jgi:hypothetical protein
MPAILDQGKTAVRDALKSLVTHVGVATDQTTFDSTQTALDPANGGSANLLIKASSEADVNPSTFDATMTIDGDSEFTGKTIWTVGVLNGSLRTNALTRTVRSVGIGVQAGDSFTIGVRVAVEDNS